MQVTKYTAIDKKREKDFYFSVVLENKCFKEGEKMFEKRSLVNINLIGWFFFSFSRSSSPFFITC